MNKPTYSLSNKTVPPGYDLGGEEDEGEAIEDDGEAPEVEEDGEALEDDDDGEAPEEPDEGEIKITEEPNDTQLEAKPRSLTPPGKIVTRVRRTSREIPVLPPPTSYRDKKLREINASLRMNMAKKVLRAYANVNKDLNLISDSLSETLNTTQAGMNDVISLQDRLHRVSDYLLSLPLLAEYQK